MTKTQGFKWSGFKKPVNQIATMHTMVQGNFLLELVLPNALKIDSFIKLRDRMNRWLKSHGETKVPDRITCTKRQRTQYEELFLKSGFRETPNGRYLTFQGIPVIPHGMN